MLATTLYQVFFFSLASAHGVILAAQGEAGSPPSRGFRVDPAIARNCTTISPCQQDTTIIREAEIAANIVNKCGRTELKGNIDIGEETENELAAGQVTKVKAGTKLTVTIHQVNADGAGPYTCDIDQTGNSGLISRNLTVTNNVPGANGFSQARTQQFNITVELPNDLSCTGASTGNACTIRCRNNALAGPFGGCFAVQQVDTKAAVNNANSIQTFASNEAVNQLIEANNRDFAAAVKANQIAGTEEGAQGRAAVEAILSNTIVSSAAPVQTPALDNVNGDRPVASGTGAAPSTLITRTSAVGAAPTNGAGAGAENGNQRNGNGNNGNGNGNGNGNANGNGGRNGNANGNGSNNNNNNNNNNNKRTLRSRGQVTETVGILRRIKRAIRLDDVTIL